MKRQEDIRARAENYKARLAMAVAEKEANDTHFSPDLDLIIFSLVDKLETLLWVLETELPEPDVLEALSGAALN